MSRSVWWRGSGRTLFLCGVLALCTATACDPVKRGGSIAAPALAARTPADELYELSPARVHVRRLGMQALRLLAPHWARVRDDQRETLQKTLLMTLSEERVSPFVRAHLRKSVEARPDLAAATIEWLKGPIGYEVKFAEATAWSGDKASDAAFYASVADIRDNRTPEIRVSRIRRLAEEAGALDKTLDLMAAVGGVVSRLVNVTRADGRQIPADQLRATIARERERPDVADAYRPVVTAALLVRCRDLDLQQLDGYIDFAATEAGRWYHTSLSSALASAVGDAAMDVEGVFEANAQTGAPELPMRGVDLDSLLVELPSGRKVRFLTFAQGGSAGQPSIVLRYETSLSLGDTAAVSREADEVWDKVRVQLESEGARAAVLQATGSVEGWVFPFGTSRKFAWTRDEAGKWTPSPERSSAAQREMLWSVPP